MKIILNNIVFLTLFISSAFNSFGQSLGDPTYDDNIDSYRLIAVSNDSIESTSNTISVEKPYALYAPNAFSPDGDGINDYFNIVGQGLTNYIIEIYNRWGQMVFKSTNLDNQWDGKFQQINSPPGTYVYKIKTTDFGTELKLIKSGTVSLVR